MGKDLKGRIWRVRIGVADGPVLSGAIETETLDIDFHIKKSLRPDPNKAEIKIYNLHEDNRHAIEALNLYDPKKKHSRTGGNTHGTKKSPRAPKVGRIRVELEAGYIDTGMALLFRGDLRRAISKRAGEDIVLEIEGEDGGRTVLSSRIREAVPPGTSLLQVVRALAGALGLGEGNLLEVRAELASRIYTHGTTLYGSAADELKGVLRRAGVAYSIQNGVLHFRKVGPQTVARAVLLDNTSGLVGTPERDATGTVLATSLLNPDISIGGYVQLESKSYKGAYRVLSIEHVGSTSGTEWFHKLELTPA